MPRAASRSAVDLWFNRPVVTPARDREALEQAVATGSEQLKLGRLDLAQASFREALAHEPDNARVLALLGLTYFRGQQFAEAQPIYEALVERAPTDASHRLNLGLVYLKVNEHDKAITSLEASRALDPGQGRAVNYLGLAYARAGRYAEAYRSFLLAGQNELAIEIEANLTTAERDGIHSQLGRTPQGPIAAGGSSAGIAVPRTVTPQPAAPRTVTPQPAVARTTTPAPRTKPPSAPPKPATKAPEQLDPQLSHPEISIEKLAHDDQPRVTMLPARSGASIVDAPAPSPASPPGAPQPPSTEPLKMTESMQFVLPKLDAPVPVAGVSMISQAVAIAAPSAAASAPPRTASGGTPPRPLSELATDELLRPDDGSDPFEISASGALIIRVTDRVLTRLDGVHITGGDLQYDLAMRRSRGHATEERFDYGGTPLHTVSGHGYLIAVPGKLVFSAVTLDDDILYLREDLVFAFENTLRWESGNVPGLRGKLPVVQFRGDGALAVRLERPLVRVKLPASGVVFVDAERLAGWIGRVIPRAVVPPAGGPMGAMCVECTGEGIVLIEPKPEGDASVVAIVDAPSEPVIARTATPPPPPPAAPPAEAKPEETDPDAAIDSLDRLDEI
jgi:Tfp pilus assembly protein PilF